MNPETTARPIPGPQPETAPRPPRKPDAMWPEQRLTYLEGDLVKAKALVWNAAGLILSSGLVGGLVWVFTHLEVVFG